MGDISMTNMQCQSYVSVYRSSYDLNSDINGSVRCHNINTTFQNGNFGRYMFATPAPQGSFELLRQTILMQETTFRDQVQELHRLYERQRELMSELKSKKVYMNHLQSEDQSSNSFLKCSSSSIQNTLHDYPLVNMHYRPFVGAYNIHNRTTHLNNVHLPESKGRKIGRRFLDLELPAEVYIDSEDRKSNEDAKLLETPMPTGPFSNKPSEVVPGTHPISSVTLQGVFRTPRSFAPCSANLTDLNEPKMASYLGKNDEILGNGHEVHHVNPKFLSGSCRINVENNPSMVQALPCIANRVTSGNGAKLISRIKGRNTDHMLDVSPRNGCSESNLKDSVASLSSLTSDHSMNVNSLIDLNSEIAANTEFSPGEVERGKKVMFPKKQSIIGSVNSPGNEDARKSKKCRLIDINLPYNLGTEEELVIDNDQVGGGDYKNSTEINFLHKVVLEIDLEAPPSPELEERPPPRGDSEENHPETCQFSTAEDADDQLLELAKFAAEAIVSISTSNSETYHGSRDFQKFEASDNDTLRWFAGFIDSICHDPENDLATLSSIHDTHKLDEFEAMTLELVEMKEEEYWCNNSTKIENFTCLMALDNTQTRKGRTRRSKRKDFQNEVLPALASLSRYEVTEDIQLIEGLMEAAGTPWHLTRTRRACRKPRALKQRIPSASNVDDLNGGALKSWMKPNRRPRRPRNPASVSVILTRWLEFAA